MSYTIGITPDHISLEIKDRDGTPAIWLGFTCPRCNRPAGDWIERESLIYGQTIQCYNPECFLPGQRYGYALFIDPALDGMMLGLADRPLNTPEEIAAYEAAH